MSIDKLKLVSCPTCKKKTPYSVDNKFRPFCSDRCHLIDLGAWASEEFRIPLKDSNAKEEALLESLQGLDDEES